MASETSSGPLGSGFCELRSGQFRLAAQRLEAAVASAPDELSRARAALALGEALMRIDRMGEAEATLNQARAGLVDPKERARAHLLLGNIHFVAGGLERARGAYAAAAADARGDTALELSIELNRLRMPNAHDRLGRLAAAARALAALDDAAERARMSLAVATQASEQPEGELLARTMFDAARDAAMAVTDDALLAEAYDGLAALYERAGRHAEALRLTERGLLSGQRADSRYLLARLEWRAGRLFRLGGDDSRALAAYRRAVGHVEAIRADIPIRYVDGKSSFRELLEPLYLGLVDLLLHRASAAARENSTQSAAALLRQARDSVELIKQSELQDYLRDRCLVAARVRGAPAETEPPLGTTASVVLPPGTAVYYPIVLADRLELLVETASGLQHVTVPVAARILQSTVLAFDSAMRANRPVRPLAENLYQWLLEPVLPLLAGQRVDTIVAVPDGVLRLLPMGALHDGHDFVVRRYAFATAPGLTLTAPGAAGARPRRTLLAGLSEPGPVVDKLPASSLSAMAGQPVLASASLTAGTSPLATRQPGALPTADALARSAELRRALALPGVLDEISGIQGSLAATTLLDKTFTLGELRSRLRGQTYTVLHIASHGVFGSTNDDSFILTYDELLKLDDLAGVIGRRRADGASIELISLSACRTAEGDDRAPLGMSGAALKARAASALGTLWSVADEAAQRVMTRFYALLAQGTLSKAQALREAQLELIDKASLGHPFFWAPFVLAGDWR